MSATLTAVRCGNTKVHGHPRVSGEHHHASVAEVRQCFTTSGGLRSFEEAQQDAEGEAEVRAEQANERYFEERGGGTYAGSQEEARDRYLDSLHEEVTLASFPVNQGTVDYFATSEAEAARVAEEKEAAAKKAQPVSFIERFAAARAAEAAADNQPEADAALAELAAEPAVAPAPVESTQEPVLYDGIYTLPEGGGHRTFRLRTQAADAAFAPGKRVLQYLSGADNDHDYTGFAFVEGTRLKVWARHKDNVALVEAAKFLLADPGEALKSVECYRCHHTLTVPASLYAGLGPECAKKAGS